MMTDIVITAIILMITKTPPPTPAAIRRLVSGVPVPILTVIRTELDKISVELHLHKLSLVMYLRCL